MVFIFILQLLKFYNIQEYEQAFAKFCSKSTKVTFWELNVISLGII